MRARPSWASRVTREAMALALLGVGAALFAALFRQGLLFVYRDFYRSSDLLTAFEAFPIWLRLVLPALGGGAAGALALLGRRFGGSQGVGGVMEAVVLERRTKISLRATIARALASWMAMVTGGSVGREGPIIQFGGGLGGALAGVFRLPEGRRRALIAAGTSAGFAAAYNTPVAAILFVLEIVTGVAASDVLPRVAVATAIATAVSRAISGGGPIYGQRSFTIVSNAELVAHLALGALAGVVAVGFMGLLSWVERLFERRPLPLPVKTALGGLGVGVVACALPAVTGNGYEGLGLLLSGSLALSTIVWLLVGKAVATSASVSSGTPGGVFTPSLFLGAALGAAFGHALTLVTGDGRIGAAGSYAIVGMAAMTAGTTHAPIMASVLAFELSGDYAIVLPLLVATAASTLVARRLRGDSIYTAELRRSGLTWELTLRGREVRSANDGIDPGSDI